MRQTRTYTDFSLDFTPHPVTGDISLKVDADAVKASVKNLIRTINYEIPFHSEIGIVPLLFENTTSLLENTVKQQISNLIDAFEPRAILQDVVVNVYPTENAINITVIFKIVNTESPVTVTTVLERTR